jgi:ribosomal-protein-serine acetyltransferase
MENAMIFAYQLDEDIVLELQSPEQAEELFSLVDSNREFIGEHMAWVSRCPTIEDFREFMQRDLQGMATERRWAWLIRYKGQAAGRIGIFVTIPEIGEAELNYWLGEGFTGMGIISRAAKVITDFAFATLKMNHVLIGFLDSNPKSGAVAERIGYKHEFTKRKEDMHAGEWIDVHFWGAIASEWKVEANPIFEHDLGDGLTLRLHQVYDAQRQYELVRKNFEGFRPFFRWANDSYSLDTEIVLAKRMLELYANGTRLCVSVWQDGQFAGSAAINPDPESLDAQVGYWLDEDWRGKGIMSRTVKALMHYAFRLRGMQRFYLRAAEDNQPSRALAERLGMSQEAIMRGEDLINGRFVDHVLYSVLAGEFAP